MATVQLAGEEVRKQLEELLNSPRFARNERLSRFLRFIVEQHLEGRNSELKESVIGVEVFGRKPDYNPKFDPIVRTEARRLRVRLSEYYAGAGAQATVIIELPKGGYVPAVRTTGRVTEISSPLSEPSKSKWRNWLWVAVLFAAVVVPATFLGWVKLRAGHRQQPLANSPAYVVYLRARASEVRPACTGVELAIELFEEAIAKDSTFAPAYAGLAAMEAARSGFDRFSDSERSAMISKGWAAVQKAMQLAPRLAETQDALAMMQARQAQWRQAEQSFRHAIDLSPRDPLWRDHFTIFFLLPLGRIQEAITVSRAAEELDPNSLEVHYALTLAFRAVGRFDDADFHCRNAAENERQMSICWADTFLRQGRIEDGIRILETAWNDHLLDMGAEFLGVAYARVGRRDDAERIAAIAPRPGGKFVIFTALGDKDRAFAVLNRMVPMGPTRLGRDLTAPEYASLRGDARLLAIQKRLGLAQ